MFEILQHSLMISGFVLVMMLVIEYLNVLTRGGWDRLFSRWKLGQTAVASLLGASPGCLGAYAIASMYMHKVVTVGSLFAAMVATCGDEAFLMLALFPEKAILLFLGMFVGGLLSGVLADFFLKRRKTADVLMKEDYKAAHADNEQCVPFSAGELVEQWKKCSPQRGILSLFLALFILGVGTGYIGHQHFDAPSAASHSECTQGEDGHKHHDHHDHGSAHGDWDWVRITLMITGLLGLLIVASVPEHFLEEHLWNHIVRVHVWRIFLWTFGSMLVVHLLMARMDVVALIEMHAMPAVLIACLIGLIPQSGPHIVFVTLYAEGSIPFYILLANSVVQDGHGMIPVLAHSRRAFLIVKIAKFLLGLVVGLVGYYLMG